MIQSKKMYTEAYIVLQKLALLSFLPKEIIELLEKNYEDDSTSFKYDENLPIEYQNLDKDTKLFLSYLYIKYYCKSSNEKKQFKELVVENSTNPELKKKEKYGLSQIFDDKTYFKNIQTSNNLPCVSEEKRWCQKIFDKIKEILHFNKK